MPYTFTNLYANNSYAHMSNVGPSNLVFLKTYNTEFDEIIKLFTDQDGRSLEIKDKLNMTLSINKQKWHVMV